MLVLILARTLARLNWTTNTNTGETNNLSHVHMEGRKMIDYVAMMQEYYGKGNDGFLTDAPRPIQLSDDDYVRVRYNAKAMRWIPSRPSRITYPTAEELINQYRREYSERWGE